MSYTDTVAKQVKLSPLAKIGRSLIDSLYNILDFIGLGDFAYETLSSLTGSSPMTPAILQDVINEIVSKSRQLGLNKQTQLSSQLESLAAAASSIPSFKVKISDAARKVKSNLNKLNYNLSEAETHLGNATSSLSQYSAMKDRDKASNLGLNLVNNMINQAEKAKEKFEYDNKGEENV